MSVGILVQCGAPIKITGKPQENLDFMGFIADL
jgi:hypothetical protein